ncbi:MAG: AAA family ATPase [Phycisphaerae bacterium]|nr:AAA family ATPase [Phycisphaerae bacterium]
MTTDPTCLAGDDVALLERVHSGYEQLTGEIGKVIIAQTDVVRDLLAAVFCQGHVLIIGVPGLAKTLLVKTLADVLGWSFKRIQFTPDMMPADIMGMELLQDDPDTQQRGWRFRPGPIFANLVLADEINRTPPKTQAALLEAMQEYHVTSMGKSYALERPFQVVATQNPIEQEGTYPLPEAQLDRFMFSIWIDYPAAEEEEQIVAATTVKREAAVQQVFSREEMGSFQELVLRLPASSHIVRYATRIARASRPQSEEAGEFVRQYVEWGAGLRASQYMVLAAKAFAALDGEPAVTAAHVRQAAPLVLRHRVLPNYNATGDGITAQQISERLLDETSEPSYA